MASQNQGSRGIMEYVHTLLLGLSNLETRLDSILNKANNTLKVPNIIASKSLTADADANFNDIKTVTTPSLNISLEKLEEKTQNIAAVNNSTILNGNISITNNYTNNSPAIITSRTVNIYNSTISHSVGAKFTIVEPIVITAVGILNSHWLPSEINERQFIFWSDDGKTSYPYTILRSTPTEEYYILDISNTPLSLSAGAYRFGVNTYKENYWTYANQTFDPRISNVSGVYSSNALAQFPSQAVNNNSFLTGNFWFKSITKASLSINGASLVLTEDDLLQVNIGGVDYPLAGSMHSIGGRWNAASYNLIYIDKQGFRLYWSAYDNQFQYQLDNPEYYGSNSVVWSCLTQSEGPIPLSSVNGTSSFIAKELYYFTSGTMTPKLDVYMLTPGRTQRLTLCSGNPTQSKSPLYEIVAMRTVAGIIWTLRRNSWK